MSFELPCPLLIARNSVLKTRMVARNSGQRAAQVVIEFAFLRLRAAALALRLYTSI
jgi:hypothetical protein